MAKTIKCAPDLEEIYIKDGVMTTTFNGSKITYKFNPDEIPVSMHHSLKVCLRTAIGMSSKPSDVKFLMDANVARKDGTPAGTIEFKSV